MPVLLMLCDSPCDVPNTATPRATPTALLRKGIKNSRNPYPFNLHSDCRTTTPDDGKTCVYENRDPRPATTIAVARLYAFLTIAIQEDHHMTPSECLSRDHDFRFQKRSKSGQTKRNLANQAP